MPDLKLPLSCEQFEASVSDFIDGALTAGDRATMDAHATQCASCLALLLDVRTIVGTAATLPPHSPSRDLWEGIAQRLETPVVSIGSTSAAPVTRTPTISFRMFAAAAALLVSVSSGVTYFITRGNIAGAPDATTVAAIAASTGTPATAAAGGDTPAAQVNASSVSNPDGDAASAPNSRSEASTGSEPGTRTVARYASSVESSTNVAYEREITAMRRIVDERLGDLDSVTVVEIERNLRIIDKAVNDSRRALQNDPRSRFLSKQLDRALESKLDIMRRIALL